MIYQELALAPHLSVEANIMLGQERVRAGLIRRREHRALVARALELLDHREIRPDTVLRDLSVACAAACRGGQGPRLRRPGDRV